MNRHALLKKIAVQATLFAGLVSLQGAHRQKAQESVVHLPPHTWSQIMPPMPEARFPQMHWPQGADIEFEQVVGAQAGAAEAETTTNTADLIALGFGAWPPPGVDSDPALIRQRAAWNDIHFENDPNNWSGMTHALPAFAPFARDPESVVFPFEEANVFAPAKIQADLPPLDTAYHLRISRSLEAHEALHAVFAEREALLDLLFPERSVSSLSASKASGHGPQLEAILASAETPRQTEARHDAFDASVTGAANDSAMAEYPLLYTEMRSYFAQIMIDGIATGRWDRLPRTRGELWAATYNAVGGVPFQPEGGDAISIFFNSPAGLDALKAFPALPMAVEEAVIRLDLNKLNPSQKFGFYNEVLPEIYGELLEDFGDAHGLAKMGRPEGPVHALAFLHHLLSDHPGGTDNWSEKEWKTMAAQVEPPTFPRLCELAAAQGPVEGLQSLLATLGQPGHSLTEEEKAKVNNASLHGFGLSPDDAPLETPPLFLPFQRATKTPTPPVPEIPGLHR